MRAIIFLVLAGCVTEGVDISLKIEWACYATSETVSGERLDRLMAPCELTRGEAEAKAWEVCETAASLNEMAWCTQPVCKAVGTCDR